MSEAARFSWFRRATLLKISLAYAAGLVLGLIALEWWAEFWMPLAILAFAPPLLLLLPLGLLLPWAVWRRQWRALGVQLACVGAVLFIFMAYRLGRSADPAAPSAFTIVTHNIGQGNRASSLDSFPDTRPDAILLQDVVAPRRWRDFYEKRGYKVEEVEPQFMLLSPHPIESSAVVPGVFWNGLPVAARFVLNVQGQRIAIYSVHLPTPRHSLAHIFSRSTLEEMLWIGKAPTDGFPSHREWLNARMKLARQLADVFSRETLPFFAGGDFNMPDHGRVYHTFASRFLDAHAEAGRGWGFTFPGEREGRLAALAGSWLRLDYVFAGPGWKAVECRVADDDRSQHRPVLARFTATN